MQKTMPPKLEDGTDTVRIQIVAPETLARRIDEWRSRSWPIIGRSEAIRILLERALSEDKE